MLSLNSDLHTIETVTERTKGIGRSESPIRWSKRPVCSILPRIVAVPTCRHWSDSCTQAWRDTRCQLLPGNKRSEPGHASPVACWHWRKAELSPCLLFQGSWGYEGSPRLETNCLICSPFCCHCFLYQLEVYGEISASLSHQPRDYDLVNWDRVICSSSWPWRWCGKMTDLMTLHTKPN